MQLIQGEASNYSLTAYKRPLRAVYGQTQLTPYACYLDPSLRNSEGEIELPTTSTKQFGASRKEAAYTQFGGLPVGLVVVRTTGENVVIAAGAAKEKPFGFLGQNVGGKLDNVYANNEVAAWRGPDGVVDVLAPLFNTTGLTAAVKTASEKGEPAKLWAGTDGRLTCTSNFATQTGLTETELLKKSGLETAAAGELVEYWPVAEVIEYTNAAVLRINVLI